MKPLNILKKEKEQEQELKDKEMSLILIENQTHLQRLHPIISLINPNIFNQ